MHPLNIYLDVDGVLITRAGAPAPHLHEFVEFVVSHYPTFWLTTHAKEGDARTALAYLMVRGVEDKTLDLLHSVRPTTWDISKTEAIDIDSNFLWFDDTPFEADMEFLKQKGKRDNFILVDLEKNPNQLFEFVIDFSLASQR